MTGKGELDPQVAIDDVPGRLVDGHFGDPADFCKGA